MPITAQCPSCGKKGSVPDVYQGRQVKCSGCGKAFVVGGGAGAIAAKPTSSPGAAKPSTAATPGAPKPTSKPVTPKPGAIPAPKQATPAAAARPAAAAPQARTIGAGYKIITRIGKGAFAEVWKGEAPGGIAVAIKILAMPPQHEDAKAELEALELIKKLRHPFLLQTQAYWTQKDRIVIVMELADGSLCDRLKECQKQGLAEVPVDELLRYFRETAEALDYLHSQGVMHRDVKPENILLIQGHAKVADMGLARQEFQGPSAAADQGTGTPNYMAPEVWDGKVSPQADIYALAVTYAGLRLNRLLFDAPDLRAIKKAHIEKMPDLTGLSNGEQQVLLKALAKNSKDRPVTCKAFLDELEQALPRDLRQAQPASSRRLPQRLPDAAAAQPVVASTAPVLDLPDEIGLVPLEGTKEASARAATKSDENTREVGPGPKAKTFERGEDNEEDVIKDAPVLVETECPNCGFQGHAPEKLIGKKVKCRECGQSFFVTDRRDPSADASKKNETEDPDVVEEVEVVEEAPPPPPPPEPASPFGELPTSAFSDVAPAPASRGRESASRGRKPPEDSFSDDDHRHGGDNTKMIVGISAGVGALLLVALVGIILANKGGGDDQKQADTRGKPTPQAKIDDRPLPTPTQAKKSDPPPKKKADDPPPDKPKIVPEWVDASTEGQKLGPVRVRVTAIEVDHVFGTNPDDISKQKQLIVRLNIENASIAQRVTYKGWGATASQENNPGAQLRDDQGKAVKRMLFEKPELIDGMVVEREFAPSVQFTDLIIFEVPKTEWKTLYLELPALNYGQLGVLKFQIPETMLAFAQPPKPDEPPPKLTPMEEQKILALRKLLRDKKANSIARQRTAEALRAFGAKAYSAANDLGKALEDDSDGVRLAAAQALASMGALARPALPELTSALQDNFWRVQAEAARALGNIGPPAKDAIPKLKNLLKSKDEEVPAAASEAIKKIQGRVPKK